MQKKLFYLTIFILISVFLAFMINSLIKDRTNEHLQSEQELVKVTYNTIIEAFRVHSNIIYFNKINTKNIKEIIKDINDETQNDKIRKRLYTELIDMYENMHNFRLKQLHFHLKNNDSFLRFHRPEKFGDNLTGIRSTVEYVNKNHKPIHGFEEGRIFNGYRFVYPLKYNNTYLGSVETSVSMATIIEEFRKELNENIDFIISKHVVDQKVFVDEKSNYTNSSISKNYYYEKSISNDENNLIISLVEKHKQSEELEILLKEGELFNFFTNIDSNYHITTFFPIKNAISKETVAYIVVTKKHSEFYKYQQQYYIFLGLLIFLIAVIIYFLYRMDNTKSKLVHKDEILDEMQKIGHIGYWELDLGKNQLVWSDEVYHMFGLQEQEFEATYEAFLKHVHPEDREKVNKAYTDSVKKRANYQIEHKIVTVTGEIKYVEQECHHSFDTQNNVVQSLGTIHDITKLKLYQLEIEKAKEQFESLVSHIPDIIYRCEIDENLTMLYLNDAFKTITGYDTDEVKLNRVITFYDMVHPKDRVMLENCIKELVKSEKTSTNLEYRLITKNKKIVWVNDYIKIIDDEGYKYIEGILSDITAQKEAYGKLQKFVDTQDNIVILTDGENINFANKKFFNFLGFKDLHHFKQKHKCICEKFIDSNDKFFHLGKIQESENWINEMQLMPHSKRVVAMIGQDFIIHAFSVTVNKFEDNLLIVSFTDITQTMLEHIKLEEKTIHDKLTGAYNREYFEQNYKKLIHEFKLNDHYFGLAILDIDHFKSVNDTYGHDIGDHVLKELVSEVKKFSRSNDKFIRWGGEEFLMVLKVDSPKGLQRALDHLRVIVEQHYFKEVETITCSFGATIYKDEETIEQTIKRADNALYEAKKTGRNKVVIY